MKYGRPRAARVSIKMECRPRLAEEEPLEADPDDLEDEEEDEADWDDSEAFDKAADDYEALDDNPDHCPPSWMLVKERRLKVGEKVCAFGIYRGDKGGLVPGGLGADKFIKLVRGDAATIEQEARRSFSRNLIGGLIALVVVHLAGYGVMLAAAAQK